MQIAHVSTGVAVFFFFPLAMRDDGGTTACLESKQQTLARGKGGQGGASQTVITTLLPTEHMVLTHTLVFFSSGVESRTAMLDKIWMWRGNFGPSSTMGCM